MQPTQRLPGAGAEANTGASAAMRNKMPTGGEQIADNSVAEGHPIKKRKIGPVFVVPSYLRSTVPASLLSTNVLPTDDPTLSSPVLEQTTQSNAPSYQSAISPISKLNAGKEHSIFESDTSILRKRYNEILHANKDYFGFEALFRSKFAALRRKDFYKDAELYEKRSYLGSVEQEVKLEMGAKDFSPLEAQASNSSKPVDLKEKDTEFMALEVERDLRHTHADLTMNVKPAVLNEALQIMINKSFSNGCVQNQQEVGIHSARTVPKLDLGFLKEKKPSSAAGDS